VRIWRMKYEAHNVSLPNGTAFFWTMLTCVLAFTLASFRFMEQVYRNERDTEGVIASEKAPLMMHLLCLFASQGVDKRPFRPRFMRKSFE